MKTFRHSPLGLLAAAAVFAVACDKPGVTAPAASSVEAQSSLSIAVDTTVKIVTINPWQSTNVTVGQHRLAYEGNTMCSLTSTYGPSYWYSSCSLQALPVVVTLKSWTDADGDAHLDVSPHMRFVPNSQGKLTGVWLKDTGKAAAQQGKILYCPDFGACYDDTNGDPALQTNFDSPNGFLFRQVRHFSGYEVAAT